jgi:hypothetical protein
MVQKWPQAAKGGVIELIDENRLFRAEFVLESIIFMQ